MKLKIIFIAWWLLASIGPVIIEHYNILYDEGGNGGAIWWLTYFLRTPFNVFREYFVEYFPNTPDLAEDIITYIAGSLLILLCYLLASRLVAWLRRKRKL